MTTKFNKDMYARMRGKKDEPLSTLKTKSVRITDKGVPILAALPSSPTSAPARGASPTPSVEEIPPRNKRLRAGEKQKEKVDSRPSSVWDDAGVSMARAQETFSVDKLKVFSRVPADNVARSHLHKLMQVTLWFHSLCASIFFLFSFFFFFKCVPFSFLYKCWVRVSTLLRSTWPSRLRLNLHDLTHRPWRQKIQS